MLQSKFVFMYCMYFKPVRFNIKIYKKTVSEYKKNFYLGKMKPSIFV